jgi:hypothetical protein
MDRRIVELVNIYESLSLDKLVDMIWRGMDLDDPPFDDVIVALNKLNNEQVIIWYPQEETITKGTEFDLRTQRKKGLIEALTDWRAVIVGSYQIPNYAGVNLDELYNALQKIHLMYNKLQEDYPNVGELEPVPPRNGKIELNWTLNETRCSSVWTPSRFFIHSFVFKEPLPEILEYLEKKTPIESKRILKLLPSAGAIFVYDLMRGVLRNIYPAIYITIVDFDLKWTKGE